MARPMILFDLKCSAGHVFEAWFHDSVSYDEQQEAGAIACPHCESNVVSKAPMAPHLAGTGSAADSSQEDTAEEFSWDDAEDPLASGDLVGSTSRPGIAVAPTSLSGEYAHFAEDVISKLSEIRDTVEKNCDYVGDQFPEEARKIHYGESEKRGIYGEATMEEAEDMADEGIEFLSLPVKSRKGNA